MRVAMICNYPWDPEMVPGGVAAVGKYLTQGLARLPEIDLHLVCCQPDVPRDTVTERDGATVHFLTHKVRFSQLLNLLPQRRQIARVLRRIRPDIVHAQGLGVPAAGALDAPLPHLITIHGLIWKEPIEHPSLTTRLGERLRHRAAWQQLLRARNLGIISGYVTTQLPPGRSYRTFTLNNPVGDEIFAIRNQPLTPHVLVVGGLRRRKDPLTSIRVMERVLQAVPEATMHLLGVPSRTSLDREVAAYIAGHGLGERVKVLGLVPGAVLRQEWARASLLLIPSLEETAPVAIGEACAVGVPQVGTDSGGIPYLIAEGRTGFVRPVGDVAGLAERVIAILRDPALRDRLARGAQAAGRRNFDLAAISARTLAAYEAILAGSDSPAW